MAGRQEFSVSISCVGLVRKGGLGPYSRLSSESNAGLEKERPRKVIAPDKLQVKTTCSVGNCGSEVHVRRELCNWAPGFPSGRADAEG